MNIQGVQWADFHIRNSFSPLCKLADTVLFPHDDPNISRFWTEQTVTSASPKHGSGSDAVLHSVTKKQKRFYFLLLLTKSLNRFLPNESTKAAN